jgi:PAS domain S-box-containing protein
VELILADKKNAKHAVDLVIANVDKAKCAAELVIANVDKAKCAAELVIVDVERVKCAAELIIANKELAWQIDRRKETELALQENRLKSEQYLNNAAEIIISLDLDGNITLVNDSCNKLLGHELGVLIGKKMIDTVLSAKDVVKVSELFDKIIYMENDNTERSESRVVTKSGAIRDVFWQNSLIRDVDGSVSGVLCSGTDVTDQRQVETALEASKKKFHSYVEHSPLGIFIVDNTGKYYDCNPAAYEMLGYSREELLSMTILDLMPDEETENGLLCFKKLLEEGYCKFEINLLRKDRSEVCVIMEAVQLPEKDMFMAYCTDIDKIKIAEFELRKSFEEIAAINKKLSETNVELFKAKENAEESDRLKSAFLANMSHEIRTPMNGILGFASLLKDSKLSGKEQQEYIAIIEHSGARMLNLINNIVSISKIESGTMDVFISEININEQTELIYNLLKHDACQKNLSITFKNTLPDNESTIFTDQDKFVSILSNLVENAIKYTDTGSIEFGYLVKGKSTHDLPLYLEFYVKDTGIGIPVRSQHVIFNRFRQADVVDKMARQGAGLGLSISRAYVAMLGGRIWLESVEGKGSIFHFTIPYHVESKHHQLIVNDIPIAKESERRKLKILIVEDDKTSEMLISINVRKISREILTAFTGREAVEICRANPDIDLVLMDIQMPDMNGHDATREIRRFNKGVIIIAQTALGQLGDREKTIDAGCNDYISKPINHEELLSLIGKYI